MICRSYGIGLVAMCMWVNVAVAGPADDALKAASQLSEPQAVLAKIEEGLALEPAHPKLLELKGDTLLAVRDYAGARAAYEAYLATGVGGSKRRRTKATIATLREAEGTFLEVVGQRGSIEVSLRMVGALCVATPTCKSQVLPGQYRMEARATGFRPWSTVVTVPAGQTTRVELAMVELPSLLTVTPSPAEATVLVDGAPYTEPRQLAAGAHQVLIRAEGHVDAQLELQAQLGEPLTLAPALVPLVSVRVRPAGAELSLDGQAVTLVDGKLAIPPTAQALVARAPGHRERKLALPAERTPKTSLEVVLEAEPEQVARPSSPSRFTGTRKLALGAAGLGVVGLGFGVVFGRSSKNLEEQAFDRCPVPDDCASPDVANGLIADADQAATRANLSFALGGAALAASVALWILGSPETPVAVAPRLGGAPGLDVIARF